MTTNNTLSTDERPPHGPFVAGDLVLLTDNKSRRYLITLAQDDAFHSHSGVLDHSELIGNDEGCSVQSTKGQRFRAMRPTFEDYVLSMPRGAQVIYPKDIAPILILADIAPGHRVFESGIGSGAMSMGLLRAGAHVTGYEVREDFASRAEKNISGFLGAEAMERYDLHIRSAYEPLDLEDIDRVVLDLPEPWQVVPHLAVSMRPGGVFVAYTPSITQAMKVRDALTLHGFVEGKTMEVLNRSWHIEGQSVRPDHRMVAHTAFLTRARLAAPQST